MVSSARSSRPTPNGDPIPGPPIVVDDLPSSERFFAGGDTTIRGFALDRVGAPNTISPNGFPTGGNAVLLLNGELRFPVWRSVGAVAFVDGGNVFRRVTEFDIGELRGSYGVGLRYRSPIGPIRVDLGVKMDRRVIAGTPRVAGGVALQPGAGFLGHGQHRQHGPRTTRATDNTDHTDSLGMV